MDRAARIAATSACGALLVACTDTPSEPPSSPPPATAPAVAEVVGVVGTALGDPLPGLTASQLAAFTRGRELFERTFVEKSGLGPMFNASSCAECHGEPEEGGVSGAAGDEVETHFSVPGPDASCDPLTNAGGFVHQDSVAPRLFKFTGLIEEPLPAVAYEEGQRTTVDLFGMGLLDAVPAATLLSLADPNDANNDGISGRAHLTSAGDVGKFGRKANEGSLTRFNAGALLNEMGITNRLNPVENTIGGAPIPGGVDISADPELSNSNLDDLNAFVFFLAPPPPLPLTPQARFGRDLFAAVGCAGCHVPSLTTGDVGVAALSLKQVSAFTDLLLHDMGPELADMCLDKATAAEFRTEPLMGARFAEQFLHDGRASTIPEAIGYHGGEGSRARNKFFNLSSAQRAALAAYVNSL